jgi:predicted helicase
MKTFVRNYNYEVFRLSQETVLPTDLDGFVNNDPAFLKWTDRLKHHLKTGQTLKFDKDCIRTAFYRPFTKKFLYFDPLLNHRQYMQRSFFPTAAAETENKILCCTNHTQIPFSCQMTNCLPDQAPGGRGGQSLPFYIYEEDGSNQRENITDWALEHFRDHCNDRKITKWGIFYYLYGVLHHPEYRAKYAENLKRELPRIPWAKDFWEFSKAGKELARLHIEYEKLEPWPLKYIETSSGVVGASGARPKAGRRSAVQIALSYRVEDKMRLSKDRRLLKVNDSLTLGGVPPEAFEYRLGNRSALEWVIDQYQVTEDKHSGIRSDPNRADDPEYIVRLVGQVIRVSLETVKLVKSLPAL